MAGLQRKTINNYLEKKIEFWSYSIKDPQALSTVVGFEWKEGKELTDEDKRKISDFQAEVREDVIVSGGAIASMLLGEPVNDVDIYLSNKETARKIAQYYVNVMLQTEGIKQTFKVSKVDVRDNNTNGIAVFIKSAGVAGEGIDHDDYQYFECSDDDNDVDDFFQEYRKTIPKEPPKHSVQFMTSNAITLTNGIQIVLRFCGNAGEIHENFDYLHATNYWTKGYGVVYNVEALEALLTKRLVYVGSKFPVASLFRMRKFIKRGFTISAGEQTKVAYDISKLNLDDRNVLRDQLIGVDYAYFSEVLSILNAKKDRNIDRTYLFQILNEVFNDDEHESVTEADDKHQRTANPD
ncbi:hypothetical protein EVB91_293 [Rhizobium phage RHph_I1_18]|nr:hypothetical protein EVB91_293 [Rhizobium phage RHph_I1_18]